MSLFNAMFAAAEAVGVERRVQLEAIGLSEDALACSGGRLSIRWFERALEVARRYPKAPLPTIEDGAADCAPEVLGALNAPTLRAALQDFVTYRPLQVDVDRIELKIQDGRVRAEYLPTDMPQHGSMAAHAAFCLLASLVRNYVQGAPTRFLVQHPGSAADRQSLEVHLGTKVASTGSRFVLEFAAPHLDARFPAHNPLLYRIATRRLQDARRELDVGPSFAAEVQRVLLRDGPVGQVMGPREALSRVCAELEVSRWTVARRLADERTSFEAVSLRVRLQCARLLLEDHSVPISEVGHRVGFRSHSSFSRFFHRETGLTPNEYRSKATAPPSP